MEITDKQRLDFLDKHNAVVEHNGYSYFLVIRGHDIFYGYSDDQCIDAAIRAMEGKE